MTIHVVGAGGVGFWLATALARGHGREMIVYDDDTLTGGLGHTRLPSSTPSTKKVDLLKGFLRVSMGIFDVPKFVAEKFSGEEPAEGDLVIDCSDMPLDVRKELWAKAENKGARMIRVSYDGAESIVTVATGLPLVGKPQGGYQNVPSLALSFVAGGVGAEVINKMLGSDNKAPQHIEFRISLTELMGIAVKTVVATV